MVQRWSESIRWGLRCSRRVRRELVQARCQATRRLFVRGTGCYFEERSFLRLVVTLVPGGTNKVFTNQLFGMFHILMVVSPLPLTSNLLSGENAIELIELV